jgi:hypothetical protein
MKKKDGSVTRILIIIIPMNVARPILKQKDLVSEVDKTK